MSTSNLISTLISQAKKLSASSIATSNINSIQPSTLSLGNTSNSLASNLKTTNPDPIASTFSKTSSTNATSFITTALQSITDPISFSENKSEKVDNLSELTSGQVGYLSSVTGQDITSDQILESAQTKVFTVHVEDLASGVTSDLSSALPESTGYASEEERDRMYAELREKGDYFNNSYTESEHEAWLKQLSYFNDDNDDFFSFISDDFSFDASLPGTGILGSDGVLSALSTTLTSSQYNSIAKEISSLCPDLNLSLASELSYAQNLFNSLVAYALKNNLVDLFKTMLTCSTYASGRYNSSLQTSMINQLNSLSSQGNTLLVNEVVDNVNVSNISSQNSIVRQLVKSSSNTSGSANDISSLMNVFGTSTSDVYGTNDSNLANTIVWNKSSIQSSQPYIAESLIGSDTARMGNSLPF